MTYPAAQSRRRMAAIILPPSARSTGTTFSMAKACGFAPRTASAACSKSWPRSSWTPPRWP
eukprot:9286555-Alexandrium_andersonii.AAC.1